MAVTHVALHFIHDSVVRTQRLEKFFLTGSKAGITANFAPRLTLQLTALNAAAEPQQMDLPGYDLHELKGDQAGIFAVKVNANWRLTFRFTDRNAEVVTFRTTTSQPGQRTALSETTMIQHNAAHPGEILREWMADDIGVTQLAEHLGINRVTLSRLLNGNNGVTAPMAFKLAEAFPKTTAEFWMQLQLNYDLSKAAREKRKPLAPVRAA